MIVLLLGCGLPPIVGGVDAPTVPVREIASVPLDSVVPTDLLVRSDGTVLVLDGYRGRILAFGADGAARGPWGAGGLGRPTRISEAADGGVWAALPGLDRDPGLILHLDGDGRMDRAVAPRDAAGPLHPVDVLESGGSLVIADRAGGVRWIDPIAGTVTRALDEVAGEDLRRVVDLAASGDDLFAADTLAPRIIAVPKAGDMHGFGRTGLAVGRLARPTAVAPLPGGLLVSDSVLGAIQAFDLGGDVIGALAGPDGPVKLGHPTAVRTAGSAPIHVAVLEGDPARLHLFEMDPLPAAPPPALVRTTLVPVEPDPAGKDGASCLQCHDGLVLDSREVWDPARKHHPVGVVPKEKLPDIFDLDDQGRMVCSTCHSPHGVADAPEKDAPTLRHQSPTSPFQRLAKDADRLCVACHAGDEHADMGASTLSTVQGHPTGPALVSALTKRGDDPTKATCLSCHAMHGATGEHAMRDPGDGATCLGCHESVGEAGNNHVLGRVPGKDLLATGRGEHVALAADGGIGCLTCHDVQGDANHQLLRQLPNGAAVCLDCHAARKDLAGSPHARLEKAGTPTCVACHDLHGGSREERFLTAGGPGDPGGCLSCHGAGEAHAPKSGKPGVLGHPVTGGQIAGKEGATCLSCHDAHEASLPEPATCESCHAEQADAAHRGGHGSATCLDCHPAHHEPATVAGANPASARCLACHGPKGAPNTPKIASWEHPAPMFLPDGTRWTPLGGLVLFDADGSPKAPNENGELTCQTCHLVHGPSDAADDHLRRAGDGWKQACSSCHGDDALAYYRYFHDPERRRDIAGGKP